MEVATIITALAALLTGIASIYMILEMKRQRVAISKPVIKLISKFFETAVYESAGYDTPKISIFNFGTGPAINIMVKWDIDQKELIRTLKHFDPNNQLKIEWKNDLFYCDGSIHMIRNQRSHKVEAIPVYSPGDNKSLPLPSYYFDTFVKYIRLAVINRPKENDSNNVLEFPDYPPLKAAICFEDIGGNKIERPFTLGIELHSIQKNENDEGYKISGKIEINE